MSRWSAGVVRRGRSPGQRDPALLQLAPQDVGVLTRPESMQHLIGRGPGHPSLSDRVFHRCRRVHSLHQSNRLPQVAPVQSAAGLGDSGRGHTRVLSQGGELRAHVLGVWAGVPVGLMGSHVTTLEEIAPRTRDGGIGVTRRGSRPYDLLWLLWPVSTG